MSVPMAVGHPSPAWPVPSSPRRVTHDFGKPRAGGRRRHAGEDIPAEPGALVVAPESGRVARAYRFTSRPEFSADTDAVVLEADSGITVVLGEIAPGSAAPSGTRVRRGDPVARVGGLAMLHVETYAGHVAANRPWVADMGPPAELRDPTDYLYRAALASTAPRPAPASPAELELEPVLEPVPVPVPVPHPVAARGGGGGAAVLLALGLAAAGGWR